MANSSRNLLGGVKHLENLKINPSWFDLHLDVCQSSFYAMTVKWGCRKPGETNL
jgi:hypothetical protein